MLKKLIALTLCALTLVVFAAGCSSNDGGSSVLTVAGAREPITLDPTFITSAGDAVYAAHLFETLMVYTDQVGEKLEVAAAESYVITEEEIDGAMRQVITFQIRSSGWSDGTAVKADDFVFAIERLLTPANDAPYALDIGRYFYKGLEVATGKATLEELGVEAVSDTTLRCVMASHRADNLAIFACAQLSPVRRDIIELHGDGWTGGKETFVTNGYFTFDVYSPGDVLQLQKNRQHWFRAFIQNGTLIFNYTGEQGALDALYEQEAVEKEADRASILAASIPQASLATARTEGIAHERAQRGTLVVEMNQSDGPFGDPKAREAFALAIDPTSAPMGSLAKPAYGLIGDEFTGAAYPSAALLPTDAAERASRAQEALSAAGYPGGEGFAALPLLCEDTSYARAVADALAAAWSRTLGVTVTVDARAPAAFEAALRGGDYQLALCEKVAEYDDPAALLAQYASGSGNNLSGYASEDFDALLHDAVATILPADRYGALRAAEERLMADFAVAPVLFPSHTLYYTARMQGVRSGPYGQYFLENAHDPNTK